MRTFRMSLAGAVVLAATAAAQTTPTTPTTQTPTTTTTAFTTMACTSSTTSPLQSFSVERTLPFTGFSSSFTPTFPTGLQAAVQANTLEIRESVTYNAQNKLLTLNLFTVQSGAPTPTPTTVAIPQNSLLSILSIKVDTIYTSTGNRPGVMFVGTVATNTPASPFGDLTGTPAAVSIGYTSDTPARINNVAVVIAGIVTEFAGTGSGTVTFTSSPVTPPGTTGGPSIAVSAGGPTTLRVITLDASGTTSPNTPLTYRWSVVAGAADIGNQNAAVATGYILGGAGIYTFRVTVTDAKGSVAMKDIDVQFR